MPDYGKQVRVQVIMPVVQTHPMTGKRQIWRVGANYLDRMVTEEQADKLKRWYNRKAREVAHDQV